MEERGQYITLLCAQHQKGPLSEKTIRLLVGSVSNMVLVKFRKSEEGLYFNQRLQTEIENRQKFTESRKINGSKGGRPKKETYNKPSEKPLGFASQNLPENENINENKDIIEVKNINTEPKFQKPTESEISEFLLSKYPDCNKIGLQNFTTKFWSHYENNGWKVGKNKMKNWKLALPQWSETLQKDLFPNLILPNQPQKISKVDQRIESVKQGLALIDEMYSGNQKTNPLDFD